MPLKDWLAQTNDLIECDEKIDPAYIERIQPDIVISYSYKYIISSATLQKLPGKFINLHISLLPYNRGADPNPWSFLDGTPKGVSIHVIDAGLDTGPLIAQREVFFEDHQTLKDSYEHLHSEIRRLFKEKWDDLRSGLITPTAQEGVGTYHHSREFSAIKADLFLDDGWDVTILDMLERYTILKKNHCN